MQLNVLTFGWKNQKPMENRIFDNFVQLLGNYLDNMTWTRCRRAQQKEWVGENPAACVFLRNPVLLRSPLGFHSPSPQVRSWPAGRGPGCSSDGARCPAPVQSAGALVRRAAGNVRPLKALAGFVPQTRPPGRRAGGGDREGKEEGGGKGGRAGRGGERRGARTSRARLTDRPGGRKMAQAAALALRPGAPR